jgi:biopolymer transport protein ExbD
MRRFRSKRRKPELNAQINVTNLVDVALVILIVFMLIAC